MSMNINSSSSRIFGLASGMDIDSMVKQLMTAERMPMDKMEREKQLLEWQRDKYREVNTKLLEFRNTSFDMGLQSKYLSRAATSTNESTVSVSASSSAIEGIYTMKVEQMAKAAQLTSTAGVGAESSAATLKSLGFTGDTTLTIRGDKGTSRISVSENDSITSLVARMNEKATVTGVRASYDGTLDRFFFVSSKTGSSSKIDLISENASLINDVFKVGGATATKTASTVTASAAFGTEVLTGSKKLDGVSSMIDDSLSATQTIRISRNGQNFDFNVTSSTTVQGLIEQINVSGLNEQGVKATYTADGKLSLFNPSKGKPITISNVTSGSIPTGDTDVLVTMGMKKADGTNAYTIEDGNIDSTIINGSLTTAQQLKISYGGEDYKFTIDASTTLKTLVTNINTSGLGKAGVTAYISDGKLEFYNPDDSEALTFDNALPPTGTNTDANVLVTLGFKKASGADDAQITTGIAYTQKANEGQNAKVYFNGVEGSYETNSFTINGITFTAKKADNIEHTVTVANDVEAVFNNIKGFVDKYNEMLDYVNKALTETKYRDYSPLTKQQKEGMEDREIELWEEKAKSGLLRSDAILSNAMNDFRSALYSQVEGLGSGALDQLVAIGIKTGSYSEKGKLYIDENKLRQAISDRPDEVAALFTTDDGVEEKDGDGIAVRMLSYSENVLARLKEKAGTSVSVDTDTDIGKKLYALESRMISFTDRLTSIEDRYYRQFTAMEKFINQMNQQSSYIAQNFTTG